jgi:hypothetical protein
MMLPYIISLMKNKMTFCDSNIILFQQLYNSNASCVGMIDFEIKRVLVKNNIVTD